HVVSVKHRGRIGAGMLDAATSAVLWAILHARTFEHDVVECGECGGCLRDRAVIVDPGVATEIPSSLSSRVGHGGAGARGPPSDQLRVAW
ncbi:MAG: hypothetical protein FWD57_07645, partial [Polyangiaceae bacterium]|nr:hypothetical protein [Polyangiaceae bacterium]